MPSGHAIRLAAEADAGLVSEILQAMDRHYRPDAVLPAPGDYAAMAATTIREREGTRFALCLSPAGRPVGVACFAVLRPGRAIRGLVFLKDLFVREEMRGQGLGTLLMQFLARFCLEHGIARIDLRTDPENQGAQRLYGALGGTIEEKVTYSFPTGVLAKLAG